MPSNLRVAIIPFLLLTGSGAAQIQITDVVNAGSRIAGGSPSGGIAQGALFVVTGQGVGPDEFQQASFPLPAAGGLGGVTIQVTAGGLTVDAIMVYVFANEVAAILPSIAPVGPGTVTVNNNGDMATAPFTVVAAAFGIFTRGQTGPAGQAVAFNVAADGSTAPNGVAQSAQPGQDVLINGTGLGAIASDETQSGVTDAPYTSIQVYAGVQPAAVVSAGRGLCCNGLDPDFPVPPGIAAWDVIRFTVPADVVGCFVPVAVQIGNFVSNLATISIAAGGGACAPPVSVLPAEVTQQLADQTGVTIGAISLERGASIGAMAGGAVNTTKRDTGSATFLRYADVPASAFTAAYVPLVNVCTVNGYPAADGVTAPIVPPPPTGLDAGPAIAVSGPGGSRSILRQTVGMAVAYQTAANFGNTTPGNYFDPGHYTVTGPGGNDAGAFTASVDAPAAPFVWTNIPNVTIPIDRSQDLTITWTGGAPDSLVSILGGSFESGVSSAFLCTAAAGAGSFTVPSYVLLSLAPGSTAGTGTLVVENRLVSTFTAMGLDIGTLSYSTHFDLFPQYQ